MGKLIYVIVALIFTILGAILKAIFGGSSTSSSPNSTATSEKFKIKVSNSVIDGDEFNWDTFKIEMKGSVSGPYDNVNVKDIVRILDITDGTEEVVLCTIENFQKGNSEVFWYEGEKWNLPYKDTIFEKWAQMVQVPKMFLVTPRKGLRKLKFKAYIVNASNDNILAESETVISYSNENNGYLDATDNRYYFEEMIIKSAMLVSASDGDMDTTEAKVVNDWIKKRLTGYVSDSQNENKQRLNNYVKEIYTEIKNDYVDIYDVLDGIKNIASEGDKYELFQLCLDVARADGEADKKELEVIHDIADYIGLDEKQFRSMIEKTLPVGMHTGPQTPEHILGISSDMTKGEIKKHLMQEYRKWNQRVANADPIIREQAEDMINMIADLRKKYK